MIPKVTVTREEAELKTGFKGLVERVAQVFSSGEAQIDLTFEGSLYAGTWVSPQDLHFEGGGEQKITPINVLKQCFEYAIGYPINYLYDTNLPSNIIRLSRA